MLSSVIVTDDMIRGKNFQSQTHVYFLRSILLKDADQIRYKSPSKKLGRGSKSSAGGLDSRAEV